MAPVTMKKSEFRSTAFPGRAAILPLQTDPEPQGASPGSRSDRVGIVFRLE